MKPQTGGQGPIWVVEPYDDDDDIISHNLHILFWIQKPCGLGGQQRFGRTCRLHLHLEYHSRQVKLLVLTAASMKMTYFWNNAP
jgi:hypothetical protein